MVRLPQQQPGLNRLVVISLVVLVLAGVAPVASQAQGVPVRDRTLDIAAVVLQPADLEQEGMPGYSMDTSQTFMTLDEVMAASPSAYSRSAMTASLIPGVEDMLRAKGWQRFHELMLVTPHPQDPALYGTAVVSGVEEYATADGAAGAFTELSDQQALETSITGSVVMIPGANPNGGQSTIWRNESVTTDTGAPVTAISLMVRVDNRIISTTMVDFIGQNPPDPAQAELLTLRLMSRIEAVQDAGATSHPCLPNGDSGVDASSDEGTGMHLPGMSMCVQRLIGDGTFPNWARYSVRDGIYIPVWRATPAEIAQWQAEVDAIDLRDSYELQYVVDAADGSRVWYDVFIDRFTDEPAAATRFEGLEGRARDDTLSTLMNFERGVPATGDDPVTYIMQTNETGTFVTTSATRIDNVIVYVNISESAEPLPAATQALLLSQIACMETGGCTEPIPVPPELTGSQP